MFGMLGLMSDPGRINLSLQFTNLDGTVKDTSVLNDFLDRFQKCKPIAEAPTGYNPHIEATRPGNGAPPARLVGDTVCYGEHQMVKQNWIDANVGAQAGSGLILDPLRRAKYKSCPMKKAFTEAEAMAFYNMLSAGRQRTHRGHRFLWRRDEQSRSYSRYRNSTALFGDEDAVSDLLAGS
jgi:hypothetical protein